MNVLFLSIVILIVLIILIYLDFYFGKKQHMKRSRFLPFSETSADYELFNNGDALYRTLMQDIKDAKHEVNIQFFIIRTDMFSKPFLQLLKDKANEGVKVRLLADRIGSINITKKIRADLEQANIHFAFSETPSFPYLLYKLNRRNHRKIAVIDGKIAYAGGYNLGKEYVGKNPKYNDWHDYHLRLTGEIVQDFITVFQDDWQLAGEKGTFYKVPLPKKTKRAKIVATDGTKLEEIIISFLNEAKETIYIGSPYFVPSKNVYKALISAIMRGVTIKILIPMKRDHPLVKEAAIPYIMELRKLGADIRLFDQGFYHAKVLIIDDNLCDIGTANFDMRSFFLNKEVNTLLYDKSFIEKVKELYLKDFDESIELTDDWYERISVLTKVKMIIAKIFKPIL
ncbi:cardiolipin synthase [Salirhabdus salicampi]|uniref:cardiolipin synthase n=1 Tax=Salirhabdus salicampi TaxID=476102 RepID=UPI0020C3E4C4|nr:cardiolipin synthase [Salirhabdus salicampi]MCP8617400.1 cardiolipin synthase [Salirhabdus salicampi]